MDSLRGPLSGLQPTGFIGRVVTRQDSIRTAKGPTGPGTRARGPYRGARLYEHGGQGEREMLEMRRATVMLPGSIPAAARRQTGETGRTCDNECGVGCFNACPPYHLCGLLTCTALCPRRPAPLGTGGLRSSAGASQCLCVCRRPQTGREGELCISNNWARMSILATEQRCPCWEESMTICSF